MKKLNILVIGNGGREHALSCKLGDSKYNHQVFAIPGNKLWKNITSYEDIHFNEFEKVLEVIKNHQIDYVVIGPENALEIGLTDFLINHHVMVLGPTKELAQIETSKAWSKNIMQKYHIPTAAFNIANSSKEALEILDSSSYPVVLKSSNLAAGKGVVIAYDWNEACDYVKQIFEEKIYSDNNSLVIEDFMQGNEFSLMCLVNGEDIVVLPVAQDHKRVFNHDEGPNTGGMGCYSDISWLSEQDITQAINQCIKPLIQGFKKDNLHYCGVIFAGIMKTINNEMKVIEYNARFGDPETETIIDKLEGDVALFLYNFLLKNKYELSINQQKFCSVVICAKGYPANNYLKNINVDFLKKAKSKVYLMGVKEENGVWLSKGGRIAILVNSANFIKEASSLIYEELKTLIPDELKPYLHFREDIGIKN